LNPVDVKLLKNFGDRMKIYIITIFPDYFECFKNYGVVNKAIKSGLVEINLP